MRANVVSYGRKQMGGERKANESNGTTTQKSGGTCKWKSLSLSSTAGTNNKALDQQETIINHDIRSFIHSFTQMHTGMELDLCSIVPSSDSFRMVPNSLDIHVGQSLNRPRDFWSTSGCANQNAYFPCPATASNSFPLVFLFCSKPNRFTPNSSWS